MINNNKILYSIMSHIYIIGVLADPVNFVVCYIRQLYTIQTLLNSLFNNGVQNLKLFIDHLESQKYLCKHHFQVQISENAFLVHIYMVVRWNRENCRP